MNPIRQKLIANGNIKAPRKMQARMVQADPDAIKSRDTNVCKARKAIAILERSLPGLS